jgi:hypothetical protein
MYLWKTEVLVSSGQKKEIKNIVLIAGLELNIYMKTYGNEVR